MGNFYPRSPCGERRFQAADISARRISIHALLAESDIWTTTLEEVIPYFYPRSPCGERRCYSLRHSAQNRHFYPRSPCGERPPCCGWFEVIHYFYPRSPCGERRNVCPHIRRFCAISIHALLAESDANCQQRNHQLCISIHALLAESDL